MNEYILFTTVIFVILALIWSKKSWLNLILKVTFIGAAFWGAILSWNFFTSGAM